MGGPITDLMVEFLEFGITELTDGLSENILKEELTMHMLTSRRTLLVQMILDLLGNTITMLLMVFIMRDILLVFGVKLRF